MQGEHKRNGENIRFLDDQKPRDGKQKAAQRKRLTDGLKDGLTDGLKA